MKRSARSRGVINHAGKPVGMKRGVFRTVLNEPAVLVSAEYGGARNRCVIPLTVKRSARRRGVINRTAASVGVDRGVLRTVLNKPAVFVSAA